MSPKEWKLTDPLVRFLLPELLEDFGVHNNPQTLKAKWVSQPQSKRKTAHHVSKAIGYHNSLPSVAKLMNEKSHAGIVQHEPIEPCGLAKSGCLLGSWPSRPIKPKKGTTASG
jgi:hypothetical protein